jgi:DmX-like protein
MIFFAEADSASFTGGVVNLVSKHNNGTINLWKLHFNELSKYQSLINVHHISRICGHRLRVGHISSHPVLPFLITNSIKENISDEKQEVCVKAQAEESNELISIESGKRAFDFLDISQRDLIVWSVEPVGPLSKSGGIYELARIDSAKANSFENIAWFPCFLPSSTLGNFSTSPSTLFASTDCECITIYQAVFDARTLLQDIPIKYSKSKEKEKICLNKLDAKNSNALFTSSIEIPFDSFKVVSIQSTARPGCIIELDKVCDSGENWLKADLFHVYQESLIRNVEKVAEQVSGDAAAVEQSGNNFKENYFLVLLEKKITNKKQVEIVHMWQISISSSSNLANEQQQNLQQHASTHKSRITLSSTRVCRQELALPDGVSVVCADSAAAHLSSSAMFTLSQVPYLFVTACSDGICRFWSCKEKVNDEEYKGQMDYNIKYEFCEWNLDSSKSCDDNGSAAFFDEEQSSSSQLNIGDYPLTISCSYNGRFAVAYKRDFKSEKRNDPSSFMNFCVKIYECESTGGSEWKLEDCICLKNIVLPELDAGINLEYIFGNQKPIRPSMSSNSFKNMVLNSGLSSSNQNGSSLNGSLSQSNMSHMVLMNIGWNSSMAMSSINESMKVPEIPCQAAKMSIKRQISENKLRQDSIDTRNNIENNNNNSSSSSSNINNKSLIKLDWASAENGSHLLTISLGNQVFVYSSVANHLVKKFNEKNAIKSSTHSKNEMQISAVNSIAPSKTTSMDSIKNLNGEQANSNQVNSLIKWVLFRSFELDSADDMQALPTQIRWVREGLLIIGLNTEMQVYSQWPWLCKDNTSLNGSIGHAASNESLAVQLKAADEEQIKMRTLSVLKNHSVLDLNKMNKLSTETTKKLSKLAIKPQQHGIQFQNELSKEVAADASTNKTFNENEILDMLQDSGLFMQSKYGMIANLILLLLII